jgi:hypothetical protein
MKKITVSETFHWVALSLIRTSVQLEAKIAWAV